MGFQTFTPKITGNPNIRTPQYEAFNAIRDYFSEPTSEREIGLVLPVGCGKSGCITLTPFAIGAKRVLVVAPGLNIFTQLSADFDPSSAKMFYKKCGVLSGTAFPEPAIIRSTDTNISDLEDADVVITNIQQLQGG